MKATFEHIFDNFQNHFWDHFGARFGPRIGPRGAKMSPRGAPRASRQQNGDMHFPLQKPESEALPRSQDGPKTPKMASKSHLTRSQNTPKMIQKVDQKNNSFWTNFGPQNQLQNYTKNLQKIVPKIIYFQSTFGPVFGPQKKLKWVPAQTPNTR